MWCSDVPLLRTLVVIEQPLLVSSDNLNFACHRCTYHCI
jgi:hypothetical protein